MANYWKWNECFYKWKGVQTFVFTLAEVWGEGNQQQEPGDHTQPEGGAESQG